MSILPRPELEDGKLNFVKNISVNIDLFLLYRNNSLDELNIKKRNLKKNLFNVELYILEKYFKICLNI